MASFAVSGSAQHPSTAQLPGQIHYPTFVVLGSGRTQNNIMEDTMKYNKYTTPTFPTFDVLSIKTNKERDEAVIPVGMSVGAEYVYRRNGVSTCNDVFLCAGVHPRSLVTTTNTGIPMSTGCKSMAQLRLGRRHKCHPRSLSCPYAKRQNPPSIWHNNELPCATA